MKLQVLFPISSMYLLLERGVLLTPGSILAQVSTILLCNSELERKLEAHILYLFNNTFPLLTSLNRLKLSCLVKKTSIPKKSQSDGVCSLSLPDRPPKDTGLLK